MAELTRLARYNLTVTKDKSVSDNAQVPAAATVDFYVKIVTVAAAVTVGNGEVDATITVLDIGRVELGDVLGKTSGTATVTVESIINRTTLLAFSNGTGALVLAAGERLVLRGRLPTVYKDSTATDPYSTNQVSTNADTGVLDPAYLRETLFDGLVGGSGVDRLLTDQLGGGHNVYNVRDRGGDIQAVIDVLPEEGGVVYLPAGDPYDLRSGLMIDKDNVTLLGDGQGTVIRPDANFVGLFDVLTVTGDYFRAMNLNVDCRCDEDIETLISGIVMNGVHGGRLDVVQIFRANKYGLWLSDVTAFLAVQLECLLNTNSGGAGIGHGARIENTEGGASSGLRFLSCAFVANDGKGLEVRDTVVLSLIGCGFEGNKAGWEADKGNCVDAEDCSGFEALSCYFEHASTGISGTSNNRANQFIWLNSCRGAIVDGCWFQGGLTDTVPNLWPYRAANFNNSPFSRLSNNASEHLAEDGELAFFSSDSNDCIEMGNDDRDFANQGGFTRLKMEDDVVRVIGMSRRALGLPTHSSDDSRPSSSSTVRQGSLLWNAEPSPLGATQLQVRDGSGWQSAPLEPLGISIGSQQGPIGSTALLTGPRAGAYVIEVYVICTTPDTGKTLDVSIAWTDDLGVTTTKVIDAFSLGATGRTSSVNLIKAASGDVMYSTTLNQSSQVAVYALHIRVITLG